MIDLEELRQAIRGMTRKQAFYRVLKEELTACGHWKAHPRGNPFNGYRQAKAMGVPFEISPRFSNRDLVREVANERALARANGRCEECGTEENLLVHHKDPVNNDQRGYSEKNRLDNLKVLCIRCHIKEHAEQENGYR